MDEQQVTPRQWTQQTSTEEQTPLLKVNLFGPFQFYWQVPSRTPESMWESRTSARSLFKLLLCAPGRQAAKSVLAGILWPETDEEKALESLRSAVKVLRKVLCTASGDVLIEQPDGGSMLKLAEQRRLRVDADAFEAYVTQASHATTADEALVLWQQARSLLQGEFLADDQHQEWMSWRWVKQRRQVLWMARSRMIRHLADLYLQRGEVARAEQELEQHIVRFPTDQDVLYRLLTLLEQQQCFEQATLLYTRTKHILDASGKQPTRHVRAVYERIQHSIGTLHQVLPVHYDISLQMSTQSDQSGPISLTFAQNSQQERVVDQHKVFTDLFGTDFSLLMENESLNPVLRMLQKLSEREDMPEISQIAHRQLLELGIAAFITRLAQVDNKRISAIEREELGRALGESIADSWKLFLSLENKQIVAIGRVQLSLIHQAHAFILPSTLPYLYSGVYGLIGIGLHFQEHNEEALQAYHNGYVAAQATGNAWYIAQNLICQADTYLTLGHYAECLHVLEEALTRLGDIEEDHRRAKAHIFACWADMNMVMGQHVEAYKKLDASMLYLDRTTLTEEFDYPCWLQLAGKNALMANDYTRAISFLEQALATTPYQWLARQPGILIPLAMAYARLQEREKSLLIAQKAIPVIKAFNAPMTNTYFLEYIKSDILGRFSQHREAQIFLTDTIEQLPQFASLIKSG